MPLQPPLPTQAAVLEWLLRASLSAAGIAVLVLAVQFAFGRWLSPAGRYRLWGLVVLRLLLPALPASPTSFRNVDLESRARHAWASLAPAATLSVTHHASDPQPPSPEPTVPNPQSAPGITVIVVKEPVRLPPISASIESAPVAAASAAPPRTLGFVPMLFAVWATGVLLLLAHLFTANLRLARQLRHARPVHDAPPLDILRQCCAAMGVRSTPPLMETDAVRTPAAAGVFRPKILIPPGQFATLTAAQRRAVLLHELAHVRHRDVAANWLLAVLQVLHWFNPVLWLAFARLRADREIARDATVLAIIADPADAPPAVDGYIQTLLTLTGSIRTCRPATHAAALAGIVGIVNDPAAGIAPGFFRGNRRALKRRLHMAAQFPLATRRRRRFAWAGPLLALVLAATLLTDARSQTAPTPPPAAPRFPASSPATRPTGVPVLSEIPILGRLFVINPPATRPADIRKLEDEARELVKANDYRSALQRVDQILVLDPVHKWATGVKSLLEDKVQLAQQRRYVEERGDRQIPYNDILRYPTDWPDISQTRPAATQPADPSQEKTLAQLDRPLPALQFDAVGFSDVIDFLRDVSAANIFVNWKSLEAAGIDRNTPITARGRNVKFSKALTLILESISGGDKRKKLGFTVDEGVITISTVDDLSRNVVVRVYDIRDLIVLVPNYEPPADAAHAPATRPVPEPTRQDLVNSITKLIMDTVDSDSWKDHGGFVGALRELQGQLIVTQTPENHRALVNLLNQLREERSTQIMVEARFISCDDRVFNELVAKWRTVTPPTTRPAPLASRDALTDLFLTDAQVADFILAIQNRPDASILTSPRLTLFNGQRAYVKVSTQKTYLSEFTATQKPGGDVRFEPVTKTIDPGLILDVSATTSADRKSITLTLRPKISTLLGMTQLPWPGSPPGVNLMVQEPRMKVSELQTTVSVPEGQTVLLSGLEDPGFTAAPNAPATHPRGIFLQVRPTLFRQTPQPKKDFPLFTTKPAQ